MSLRTFMKTGTALAAVGATAFAGLAVTGPTASAATAFADCTASLNAWYWSWTAQCAVTHTVTIRSERQWYWLQSPGVIHSSTWNFSRQVVPGTPWSDRILPIPETITVQLCLTAYQDSTVQIAPRTCYPWGPWS